MRTTKRTTAIVAAIIVTLIGIGAAYAYWTAGGSGTGTAATGTSSPVTAVQTSTISNLRPGGAPQTLNGTFTNPSGNGPIYVTKVTASISGVTKAPGAVGACTADDYTLANAEMTVNAEVPEGTGQGSWSGATIAFANSATANQDGCQGATVNLSYAVQ